MDQDGSGCPADPVTRILLFRRNAGWWLTVEGRSFRAPVYFADLAGNRCYRVYHLRGVHQIVAMERTRPIDHTDHADHTETRR